MAEKDKVWEFYGETNPYFGVSTVDKFKDANLTTSAKDEFFDTGETHIEKIWKEIESTFDKDFRPQRAMDFGCGVGRLVLPLSKRCEEIVGVDISPQMIEEAKKNCSERRIENADFALSDENLSKVSGKFDLIHSFIVFQHINPNTGEKIFRRMCEMLTEGGIGVLQFSTKHRAGKAEVLRFKLYRDYPLFYRAKKLLKPGNQEQLIPMYEYNLTRLFLILQENDCHKCLVRFSYHGFDGVVIFFQKVKAEMY